MPQEWCFKYFFFFYFQVNVIGIHWRIIVVGVVKTTNKMRSSLMRNHFNSEVMFRFCLVYLILASASCQAGEHNHPCRFNPECLCSTGGEVFILTSYKDWRRCYRCSIFIWESALYLPITVALETEYPFWEGESFLTHFKENNIEGRLGH